MSRKIIIASCQHAVNANINANLKTILTQIKLAKAKHADIVHFSECSLSGYAGIDFSDAKKQDNKALQDALEKIKEKSKKLNIWVIVGSHHFEQNQNKPFNSLYLLNNQGVIVDRYDKRLLTGINNDMDHQHYSLGERPIIFNINGLSCGLLICHEWRYIELYREYKRLNVDLVFQSFYDGNLSSDEYIKEGKELGELITGTMKGNAANNYLWISASNTCKKESYFPSSVFQPDGRLLKKLTRNRSGVLISKINLDDNFVDPSKHWRNKMM